MSKTKYGFQKHLSDIFPSQIIIDVTQKCNLACIHCPHKEFLKTDAYKGQNLNLKLHEKLIDQVALDGLGICQYVRYTANGEPLLHPKIDDILEYACKYSKTKVNLTTNGMLLTKEKAQKFLDFGIDAIDISIDAFYNETYEKIRKKGNLKTVRTNVLNLLELIKQNNYKTKVILSFVEQPLNQGEAEFFKQFWESIGAHFVIIRELHSAGGAKENIKEYINKEIHLIKRKPCVYPWERLVLTPGGELGFCPADWTHSSVIDKLEKKTIKEIWQSDYMNKLRKAHLENNFDDFPFCKQCPDWVYTKWPNEGDNYAILMSKIVPKDLLE